MRNGISGCSGYAPVQAARASKAASGVHFGSVGMKRAGSSPAAAKRAVHSGGGSAPRLIHLRRHSSEREQASERIYFQVHHARNILRRIFRGNPSPTKQSRYLKIPRTLTVPKTN